MINTNYPDLLGNFNKYLSSGRSESASFLIWFLDNYYRLDELDAIDAVCDSRGDKGIDGIYINDLEGSIDIFQSKISQKVDSSIGDKSLREFSGTLKQFESVEALDAMLGSAGDAQVTALINRLGVKGKLGQYTVRGIFVSNKELDSNGVAYLQADTSIQFVGSGYLQRNFISSTHEAVKVHSHSFDIEGVGFAEYAAGSEAKCIIAPVKASELISLPGIEDQSLFALNLRNSLGRTQVNKDIGKSISDKDKHKFFPLFHNGITILCEKAAIDESAITISNSNVVNGCQSLSALFSSKNEITADLRVLVKFVQVGLMTELAETITNHSNNQNGIKARDFKSNNPIQIRLQNDVAKNYPGSYFYEVKRGSKISDCELISNEETGLNIISFDLKEPWTTHRKYQVFDDKFNDIFGRPEMNSHRLVLIHTLAKLVEESVLQVKNELFGRYALTKFMVLTVLRNILENDSAGLMCIRNPKDFVHQLDQREAFKKVISQILAEVIIDLNAESADLALDFDYRGKLRDKPYVQEMIKTLTTSYQKQVVRSRCSSFSELWENELSTSMSVL